MWRRKQKSLSATTTGKLKADKNLLQGDYTTCCRT